MDEISRLPWRAVGRLILRGTLAIAGLCLYAAVAMADGQACVCPQRVQDQLWLVSDRSLGCNVAMEAERLHYRRYDCQQKWTRSSLEDLRANENPAGRTVIFLHGNRVPASEAYSKGWSAYRTLARCADERPIRFIIWSWPSDPIHGVVQDARVKANRTNVTGYYLAWFIDQLTPETPVSLWAHSFGSRAATAALHLLGGGELCGRVLDERVHLQRTPVQVTLFAAALDNHWLTPGHFHGQAMTQVSQLLLVNNSSDALLKRYRFLYHRRSNAQALGLTGMNTWALGEEATKVTQWDATCQIGRTHLFALYIESPNIMARVRENLLAAPLELIQDSELAEHALPTAAFDNLPTTEATF